MATVRPPEYFRDEEAARFKNTRGDVKRGED
jgi:hypothetical protein